MASPLTREPSCHPRPPFLLQSLHMQKSDVDLMRTKLRRLEEENNRKDRQIEQLLDPGRVSPKAHRALLLATDATAAVGGRGEEACCGLNVSICLPQGSDFVRTLAEKRPDTGWVSGASCSKESFALRS